MIWESDFCCSAKISTLNRRTGKDRSTPSNFSFPTLSVCPLCFYTVDQDRINLHCITMLFSEDKYIQYSSIPKRSDVRLMVNPAGKLDSYCTQHVQLMQHASKSAVPHLDIEQPLWEIGQNFKPFRPVKH